MKNYYKVPCRQIYCDTIRMWFAETIYCLIVLKLNPQRANQYGVTLPVSEGIDIKEI